jgi:hypothetical protein
MKTLTLLTLLVPATAFGVHSRFVRQTAEGGMMLGCLCSAHYGV